MSQQELKIFGQQASQSIKEDIALGDHIGAKLIRDAWIEKFLQHIATDPLLKTTVPVYLINTAKELTSFPYLEVTIAP